MKRVNNEQYLLSEVTGINRDNFYTETFTDSEIVEGLPNVFKHLRFLSQNKTRIDDMQLRVIDIKTEKYLIDSGVRKFILRRLH